MTKSNDQGDIAIFFTGGTIAMRPRPGNRGVVPSGDFDRLMAEMIRCVPGVGLRPVSWADLPSPHMTPQLMFKLARDVENALAEPDVLGAVVLHGTDVLVESAYMAELTVDSPKTVVFTGSMRFYSELGYDGIRNLLNAIKACLLPIPPEVGVVLLMTDHVFSARDVAKINSLNIDAFEAPGAGPVACVSGEDVLLTHRPAAGDHWHGKVIIKPEEIEPNVPLITCYTGMDGFIVEKAREMGAAGLVLEGFGAGNVPPTLVPSLENAVKDGLPVVLTTRCIEGGVWPVYAYPGGAADLEKKGVILAGRLSGPKARLLLMLVMGLTQDPEQVRKYFQPGLM